MQDKSKKTGLGRGLSSLIPVSELDKQYIRKIQIAEVVANKYQPRTDFAEEKLQELMESIRQHGVIQPVIVRKIDSGYELIAGERRFLAAKRLDFQEIPALVKSVSDQETLELALIENIQRADLNPIEEAKGYLILSKEFSLSQDSVAKKVGRSRTAVANAIRLLKLPQRVQQALVCSDISVGHAKVILGLPEPEDQTALCEKIIAKDLTVRDTEREVRRMTTKPQCQSAPVDPQLRKKCKQYALALRESFRTGVDVKWTGNKGKLIITVANEEELDRIVSQLKQNATKVS
ncbi:MAG: ParB/RepB/Spo0J family partition protein [Candidatus Auribacterota bacterium]|jgi:ParB family chromosome partitioning protein|nr:ParB/RepB/Spo0J family partition protein [Candidatus Auribacterota bacterium]